MQIKQITNREEWENFNLKQPYTLFLQSAKYGDFYRSLGEESWIFGVYREEKLVGGSLVIGIHAKRGNFFFLPYGPVGEGEWPHFFLFLKELAKKKKYDFIRVAPFWPKNESNELLFKQMGFRTSPIHILAEETWLLNLEKKTEEELLAKMEKKHRNLIRRCEKEGVRIELTSQEAAIDQFNSLHDATARRHNFFRFPQTFVKNEFLNFAKNNQAVIFNAYLADGRLDSSAVIFYYGKMAAYRHGGSLNLDHKVPTSYLIQWEAIKEAQKRGIEIYNFWGVAPANKPKHPFAGISHFKKGFGGHEYDLLFCRDLPITPKYWLNWLVETARRIKRGF